MRKKIKKKNIKINTIVVNRIEREENKMRKKNDIVYGYNLTQIFKAKFGILG